MWKRLIDWLLVKHGRFVSGFVIGGILSGLALYGASSCTHRLPYPSGTWVDRARQSTMPRTREFTLPLNNPDVVPASEADHMRPDDLVVGIVVSGRARAYPWWILSNYHVANDTVGRTPVYVAMCELCSGSAAFSPLVRELPARPLAFQISGTAVGTYQISDLQTLSQWHPFSGVCVGGALEGRKMARIPSAVTTWEVWQRQQSDTDVVYASSDMREREHGKGHIEFAHPDFFRMADPNLDDERLPTNELVFGLLGEKPGTGMAVPLSELRRRRFSELDWEDQPIVVLLEGDHQVMAYEREVNGVVLDFQTVEEAPFALLDQDGTEWDFWGRAVGGPLSGEQLRPVRGYLTEWYEWVSGCPESAIHSQGGA